VSIPRSPLSLSLSLSLSKMPLQSPSTYTSDPSIQTRDCVPVCTATPLSSQVEITPNVTERRTIRDDNGSRKRTKRGSTHDQLTTKHTSNDSHASCSDHSGLTSVEGRIIIHVYVFSLSYTYYTTQHNSTQLN
jgi:hypothetical protein